MKVEGEGEGGARRWTEPRKGPAALPGPAPTLRRAAAAVAAELAMGSDPAAGELVRRLAAAIGSGSDWEPVDPETERQIVDRLRQALIRDWSAEPTEVSPAEMLRVLGSVERVAERLRVSGPAAAPLGGPHAAEFVTGVAHDLRSPLTSILFLAETLHSGQSGEVNPVQRRQLGIIYSAALGLVSVASDIIEFVRGGSRTLAEPAPVLFSVTETMESVRDIVSPMAEEKQLRVHLFPPAIDQRIGHPLALSRVLLNLTTNGLKFTETGFVEISVRSMGETRLEFSVRDTGKGYSPELLENLYQPFRRSRDGQQYGFSGTGLGLSIARRLVSAMGSTLEVESRPTWGTRFYFELDLPIGPRS